MIGNWERIDPEDVQECQDRMKDIADEFKKCRKAFIAIGDQTRQEIIMTLLESDIDGVRVGEITSRTHLSRPAVSHHIKILKDAGLVGLRREGTRNYYYIEYDMQELQNMQELFGHIQMLVSNSRDRSKKIHG